MKKTLKIELLSFLIFVCFSLKTYGQNTYIGKLVERSVAHSNIGYVLETASYYHILTLNYLPITLNNGLTVDNIEYFIDDIVEITGHLIPAYPEPCDPNDYLLEIETIKKWSLTQDIQPFLGTYCLECACHVIVPHNFDFSYEPWAIIKEGTESDLLTTLEGSGLPDDFKTFMFNNVFFIPRHSWPDYKGSEALFRGEGKIKNDSLFLYYTTGSSDGVIECDCKGEKLTSGIVFPVESDKNKVYYDGKNQAILIDGTLQNQSSVFELLNMQGEVILRKTGINTSIDVANQSSGIYLYRLLQNGQTICIGKILKNTQN